MSDWSRLASGWKSSALGILLSLSSVMAEAGPAVYLQSGHSQRVLSIAISPDRRTLASSGADGGIKLWDLSNGRELRTLEGLAQVNSVAFSRDGGTLAAGSVKRHQELTPWRHLELTPVLMINWPGPWVPLRPG
jgi:WD40 repeat protein